MKRFVSIFLVIGLIVFGVVSTFAQDDLAKMTQSTHAAPRTAERDARQVVEAYAAAALAGNVAEAAALGEAGTAGEWKEYIEEFPLVLDGVSVLVISSVFADDEQDVALAVSGLVKLAEPEPDGQELGFLVFSLSRSEGKWSISDIDFGSETDAVEEIAAFQKKYAHAKEIVSGRISVELRIRPDTPYEKAVDILRKLEGLKIQSLGLSVGEGQKGGILAVIKAGRATPNQEIKRVIDRLAGTGVEAVRFSVLAEGEPVQDDGSPTWVSLPEIAAPAPDGGGPADGKPETSNTGKSSDEVAIFSLKYADAQSMCVILNQLFFRPNSPGIVGDVTLTPDQRLNAIIVTGSQEDVSKLEAVLKKLDQPVLDRAADPSVLDLSRSMRESSGTNLQPQPATLRENYAQLEQQAARLAEQYRALPIKATRTPGDAQAFKTQLTDAVNQAFEARQQLQRAELAQLRERLIRIEQQIVTRDRIKDEIIGRRVEELLDPDLRWEPADETSVAAPTSAVAHPQSKPDARAQRQLAYIQHHYEGLNEQYRQGKAKSAELLAAATDLLTARLGVARSPEARQTVLRDRLAVLNELQAMLETHYATGAATQADVLMAQSALLKAERQIAAEDPKSPTPSVADLGELESRLQNPRNHRGAESLPTSALILHGAEDFGRKLNEAETEVESAIRLVKKGYTAPSEVESARRNLAVIRAEYAAQIRLLELELNDAELAADTAQKNYTATLAVEGVVPGKRVAELKRDAQTAAFRVERAKTLLELYRKVDQSEQPRLEPVEEAAPTDGAEVENPAQLIWDVLGVKLRPLSRDALPNDRYRGGMQVTEIRREHGPVAVDDIIVGIHHWETTSVKNVVFVLNHPDLRPKPNQPGDVKVIFLRGGAAAQASLSLGERRSGAVQLRTSEPRGDHGTGP